MKRRIALCAVVTVVVGSLVAINVRHVPTVAPAVAASAPAPKQASAPPAAYGGEQVGEPRTLVIPSLTIRAPIVKVGQEASGEMAVPDSLTEVGWYANGPAPGNPGKAVLAMHTGYPNKPSVFRAIGQLAVGDSVQTIDVAGVTATFQVIERATYHPDTAPRERIFGDSPTARLALITCAGQWDARTGQYSDRLVIYTVRKN